MPLGSWAPRSIWGHPITQKPLRFVVEHSARRRKRGAAPEITWNLTGLGFPVFHRYNFIFIRIRLFAVMLVLPCSPHPGSPASATSVPSSASHLSWLSWMVGPRRARIDACFAQKSYQEGKWHWRGLLGETQVRAGLVQRVHPWSIILIRQYAPFIAATSLSLLSSKSQPNLIQ